MLDKRKIRLMTKAAIYEKEYGEEDLKITSYYKKDYASLNTWVTLIWITAGYVLLGGILFLCFGEALLEGAHHHAAGLFGCCGTGALSCACDLLWDRGRKFLFQKAYPRQAEGEEVSAGHIAS